MKSKIYYSILLSLFLSAFPSFAQSLTQQASAQFRAAEKADASLSDKPEEQRTRADYLRVIRSYERVYLITPHTAWADNALTSIARLYEGMKDSRNAIKTLQFLLDEYPQTPFHDVAEQDIARLSGANEVTIKETTAVENIRFWEEGRAIRVVIDLAGTANYKVGEARSPDRFFVDISPSKLNSMLTGREWNVQANRIQKIRVAQFDASTVRIVLDGTTLKDTVTTNPKDPNRIIIDVSNTPVATPLPKPMTTLVLPPTTAAAPSATQPASAVAQPVSTTEASQPSFLGATEAAATPSTPNRVVTAAKPTSSGDRSLIRSLGLKLGRVVIDAGHGGHDTGGIGPTGLTEKDLVLDVAKRLQILLESQLGAEVVMTRETDTFVPLESRTQLANEEKADLFLSIHANSSPEKSVRGVETFFLNLNTQSRDALATATRENAASEKKIHELQDLLQKIVLNDKADESRELAKHVQQAMSKRGNAGSNRGVKQAPFVVLIGASMPSVLAEISFISNPDEEKRLKAPEYRQQIADSLFQGIKSYVETLSSTKAAN
jgi:N-acetylmuramoyl-L-alanine amidase